MRGGARVRSRAIHSGGREVVAAPIGRGSLCEAGAVEVGAPTAASANDGRRAKPADIASPRSLECDCRIVVATAALCGAWSRFELNHRAALIATVPNQNRSSRDGTRAALNLDEQHCASLRRDVTRSSNSFGYGRAHHEQSNKSEDRDASESASGTSSHEDQRVGIRRRIFQRCADCDGGMGVFHHAVAGEVVPLVLQLSARRIASRARCCPKNLGRGKKISGAHHDLDTTRRRDWQITSARALRVL
ncbi:hypothetical protein AB7M17_008552 [Bradyrhizobium sp. USDA 377]